MTLTPLISLTTGSAGFARPMLIGGAAALLVGMSLGAGVVLATGSPPSVCGLPRGVELAALGPGERSFVVRRVMLCDDLVHDRITMDAYRARVATLDAAWGARPVATMAPPQLAWASTVLGMSSQYTASSWSAAEALGPPDVYPAIGDQAHAWASLGADDRAEWLHVGYTDPTPITAVEVYETFNPGAVDRIELVTASGHTITAYAGQASSTTTARRRIELACTSEPIASVRVHLDSRGVAGWNEIDAIGVQPCP